MMTDSDVERVTGAIAPLLDEKFRAHEHRETDQFETRVREIIAGHERGHEHAYLHELIKKSARRAEMWEQVKGNFIFYLLIGATGAIGTAIWSTFFKKAG